MCFPCRSGCSPSDDRAKPTRRLHFYRLEVGSSGASLRQPTDGKPWVPMGHHLAWLGPTGDGPWGKYIAGNITALLSQQKAEGNLQRGNSSAAFSWPLSGPNRSNFGLEPRDCIFQEVRTPDLRRKLAFLCDDATFVFRQISDAWVSLSKKSLLCNKRECQAQRPRRNAVRSHSDRSLQPHLQSTTSGADYSLPIPASQSPLASSVHCPSARPPPPARPPPQALKCNPEAQLTSPGDRT